MHHSISSPSVAYPTTKPAHQWFSHIPLSAETRMVLRLCLMLSVGIIFFIILAYRIEVAPDIHMDEIIYYRAAYSLATTGEYTWDVDPIFVHPPIQFLTQAAFLHLTGQADSFRPFAGTYTVRLVNALIAALTAMILFRLAERLAGLRAATIVSAILILDPYVVRINRRNMLETMAEMWVVIGLALFWHHRNKLNGRSILLIGTIFGLGLLTKELVIFGFGTLGVFVILTGRWRDIPKVAGMGAVALSVWSIFPFWAWSVGQWDVFAANKTYNLRRLLGQVQITGWNRPGVSFVGALSVNLPQYGTSYALIILGIPLILLILLTWRDEKGRFVLAWAGMMYAFFAYSIAGGALNDQFFYFLIVPVVLLIGTMLTRWFDFLNQIDTPYSSAPTQDTGVIVLDHGPSLPRFLERALVWLDQLLIWIIGWLNRVGEMIHKRTGFSQFLLWATVLLILAMGTYNVNRWGQLFMIETDNTLYEVSAYIENNLPKGTTINSIFEDAEPTLHLMLPEYNLVTLRNPAIIEREGVTYALLSSKNLWGVYGEITPDYYDWVQQNGEPLFKTYGNTYWDVALYRLDFGTN